MDSAVQNRDKTLGDLLSDIVKARGFIVTGILIGAALAALIGFVSVPHYKATMIVGPANPMDGAEVSSLLANDNLYALRHLVQRVGGANTTDFLRFENIYNGPSIAAKLLEDPAVVKGLMLDRSVEFSGGRKEYTPAELSEYLEKRVKLEPVGTTALRRLVYWHPHPEFAAYFLGRIHDLSDHHIRSDIREETTQRVKYLQDAIDRTNNPEHRRALTTLLLEQERLRMLVSIDQPYAAAVIEPPASSQKPEWPDYYLLLSCGILLGAFLGFILHGCVRER